MEDTKNPELAKFLDEVSLAKYGRKRSEALATDTCVCCGKKLTEEELLDLEYPISALAPGECQRKAFAIEEEKLDKEYGDDPA
jgi:hypothetical protein